jgi:hypothetical protein
MSSPTDQDPKQFSGFDIPHQNWFRMPNHWTDITAGITSLAELKVVEYVLKHTWGYQEYGISKLITTDEFMHGRKRKDGTRIDMGTGLSNRSVIDGLRRAVDDGFLVEEVDDSDKARVKKWYRLRMAVDSQTQADDSGDDDRDPEPGVKNLHTGEKNLQSDVKNVHTAMNNVHSRGKESSHRSEKDTLERKQQQETNSNNTRAASTSKVESDVVVALIDRGIGKRVAQGLARDFNPEYLKQKIEFHDYLQAEHPKTMKRPAAWLRKACEDDYAAPDGFISTADRERLAEEEKRRNEAAVAAQERYFQEEQARQIAEEAEKEAQRRKLQEQFGTTEADIKLWKQVLYDLKNQVGDPTFSLYVANSVLLRCQDGDVVIGSPYKGHSEFIAQRLKTIIERALRAHLQQEIQSMSFVTPEDPWVLQTLH